MGAEEMILVTGATGNTGAMLLQQLEARGARVRAMVRRQPDGGRLPGTSATIVAGDFNDSRALSAALAGVTRAYLVTPSLVPMPRRSRYDSPSWLQQRASDRS
jgi:uncharacterized protein YbjT (DUF2867 family)